MSGGYQVKVPPPPAPGSEFAREVTAVGDGVDLPVGGTGRRLPAMVGAFAREIAVPASTLVPMAPGKLRRCRGVQRHLPDGVPHPAHRWRRSVPRTGWWCWARRWSRVGRRRHRGRHGRQGDRRGRRAPTSWPSARSAVRWPASTGATENLRDRIRRSPAVGARWSWTRWRPYS